MSFDLFDNLVYVESWPLETSFRGNPSRTDVFNGENGISFDLAMRAYALYIRALLLLRLE